MTVVLLDFLITLEEFQWEKSILVISEILRPFVNTFTPDEKYSVGTRDNLPQPIQMELYKN